MQVVGREGVGEGLSALPVVNAQKGVVGKRETDAGGGELGGWAVLDRRDRDHGAVVGYRD